MEDFSISDQHDSLSSQPDSLLSALEELICPLCMGTFEEPRSLQCLHSYCENCMLGLLRVSARKDLLSCPECRKVTSLPEPGGVKELPLNFKLKRFVEILTSEEKRELIRKGSQRKLISHPQQSMCQIHEDKILEYFCEPCGVLICGQCMLDEHRIHGSVRYASEVLGKHVADLKKIIPDAEAVIANGEETILSLKSDSKFLNDALVENISSVNTYFANLRKILDGKEKDIIINMKTHTKIKEKQIQRCTSMLRQAVEKMTKSKMVLEDVVERRSEECSILLEESQIRARIHASMRLVEEEVFDCKEREEHLTNLPPFNPDSSLEEKCKELSYDASAAPKRRSKTTIESRDSNLSAPNRGRDRASAFVTHPISPTKKKQRPTSSTFSGFECRPTQRISVPPSPTGRISPVSGKMSPILKPKKYNGLEPVSEITTKSLIGPYNNVTAYPFGVCCTKDGALLVSDVKHHLFRIVTSTGKLLETVGSEGKGEGQFCEPTAIAVNREGNILVVDGRPGRVQQFTATGKFMTKFKVRGLLTTPYIGGSYGIAALSNGNVLVTDGEKACVHIFEETGKYNGTFGNLTDLKCPAGIAASENRVVLADKGGHCLYILTQYGQQLAHVGKQGSAPGDLHIPFGVALDKHGTIAVSECGNHRVSLFTSGGKFVRCFGGKGVELGQFRNPRHLCFNNEGLLVVSDEENQRMQLFDLPTHDLVKKS